MAAGLESLNLESLQPKSSVQWDELESKPKLDKCVLCWVLITVCVLSAV